MSEPVMVWCDFDLGLEGRVFESRKAAEEHVWKRLQAQGATLRDYMKTLEEDGLLTFRKVKKKLKNG